MARDRFSERAITRQRRKQVWVTVGVVLALVVAGMAWAAWSSSWLGVKQVHVQGVKHLSEAEVIDAAAAPMGTSLLRADVAAIEKRVAELPLVRDVRVDRSFPDALVVVVSEREAVAWTRRGGKPWAVDAAGVVYRPLNATPKHLPRIVVKRGNTDAMEAAARVAADLADSAPELLSEVVKISAKSQDSITLSLRGNRTVTWGDSELTKQKAQTLGALLNVSARHYDVSAPERPTTKE